MVKKISIIIIVTAILVTGYISVKKLNYWERTVLLFKLNSSGQSFGGRGERGFGSMERRGDFERGRGGNERNFRRMRTIVPDSTRERSGERREGADRRVQNRPSASTSGIASRDTTYSARGSFSGRMRDIERRGDRGIRDIRDRKPVNLNNVIYFLSAFAFFTVMVIYLEKVFCLITRRKQN